MEIIISNVMEAIDVESSSMTTCADLLAGERVESAFRFLTSRPENGNYKGNFKATR